jgi:hypothetical protein
MCRVRHQWPLPNLQFRGSTDRCWPGRDRRLASGCQSVLSEPKRALTTVRCRARRGDESNRPKPISRLVLFYHHSLRISRDT